MLAQLIQMEVERGLKAALRPAALYLRTFALGLVFLGLAGLAALITLMALAAAVYLALIQVLAPAPAALVLALASVLAMLVLGGLAIGRLRPPR